MAAFAFDGQYRRTQGDRHTYRYEAEWTDSGGDDVTWSAVVRRGTYFCGATSGTLKALSTPRTLARVRTLVEHSIEHLSGGLDE